jgi:hypothetical protein
MHVELDHFFICVAQAAPEAGRLVEFGLTQGAANRHPGQGTANRRFFFHNAFLELVWVDEPAEAQSALVAPTRLWQRWSERGRGASPFGICLRPTRRHGETEAGQAPFTTWVYRPPYLPAPLAIAMSTNSHVAAEPLLFFIEFGRRPDADEPGRRQPLGHAAGLRAITRVRVSGPSHEAASAELRAAELACPWLSIATLGDDLAELGFDGEIAGKSHDFRPDLPLVFRW